MLIDVPDWSTRHNYWHHSNPRSKDRAKTIYEKAHVRPLIDAAYKVLKTESFSSVEKTAARMTLDRLKANRSSANMEAGRAVQTATDLHLVPDEFETTLSLSEATETAVRDLKHYSPKDYNASVLDNDRARQDKYLDELPMVIEHAVLGLKEAMRLDNRIIGEIDLIDTLPGNAVPHFTKPDYGRRGDLKTKWSRMSSSSKSGWTAGSLPRSLTGMFDLNNVYQAAGFWALNGHQPPFLVYANATDYRIFDQSNCPELRDDYLHDVVADISLFHKTTENILRAARTKDELLGLVSPDWNAIYWSEPPTYLEEAKKMWGVN